MVSQQPYLKLAKRILFISTVLLPNLASPLFSMDQHPTATNVDDISGLSIKTSQTAPLKRLIDCSNQSMDKLKNLLNGIDGTTQIIYEDLRQIVEDYITPLVPSHEINLTTSLRNKFLQPFIAQLLFSDADLPRFKDISSQQFLTVERALQSIAQNEELPTHIRWVFAFGASLLYQTALPCSGLPIEDPHLQGAINWLHYVMDQYELRGGEDPTIYLESCHYISGLYERRAQTALSEGKLEAHHSLLQSAREYYAKSHQFIIAHQHALDIDALGKYLQQETSFKEKGLAASFTLEDEAIKDLIDTYELMLNFAIDPPHKTLSPYISSSRRLKQLNALIVASNNTANGEEVKTQYTSESTTEEEMLWDPAERSTAKRLADKVRIKLGYLYYRTPQSADKGPDFKKAANYFSACENRLNAWAEEWWELPELQPYLNTCRED